MPVSHFPAGPNSVFHEAINDSNTTKDLKGTKELILYV